VCYPHDAHLSDVATKKHHWLCHSVMNLFFSAGLFGDVTTRMRARRLMGRQSAQSLRQCLERVVQGWMLRVYAVRPIGGHVGVAAAVWVRCYEAAGIVRRDGREERRMDW
jgi:hypothetical protein